MPKEGEQTVIGTAWMKPTANLYLDIVAPSSAMIEEEWKII